MLTVFLDCLFELFQPVDKVTLVVVRFESQFPTNNLFYLSSELATFLNY